MMGIKESMADWQLTKLYARVKRLLAYVQTSRSGCAGGLAMDREMRQEIDVAI